MAIAGESVANFKAELSKVLAKLDCNDGKSGGDQFDELIATLDGALRKVGKKIVTNGKNLSHLQNDLMPISYQARGHLLDEKTSADSSVPTSAEDKTSEGLGSISRGRRCEFRPSEGGFGWVDENGVFSVVQTGFEGLLEGTKSKTG